MAEFNEILNDFDIPVPGAQTEETEAKDTENVVGYSVEEATERLGKIFSGEKTSKEQAPEKTKPDVEAKKETTKPAEEVKDKKPAEPAKPVDFSEASKKAFFSDDGNLNAERVGDYFLNSEKYSVPVDSFINEPIDKKISKEEDENRDPEVVYTKSVTELTSRLPDILKAEKEGGFTPEQTLQRLINTLDGFAKEKEQRLNMKKALETTASEFKSEVEQIREDKIRTRIAQNTLELAHHYDNLIPGMEGVKVLDQFMLHKKYGGRVLDSWFMRENPGFGDLSEIEKAAVTSKWFKNFQTNKRDMATVAEFGRAMWLVEQIPEIIKHAQKIGAQKSGSEKAAKTEKPSEILPKQTGQSSRLAEFFDKVN